MYLLSTGKENNVLKLFFGLFIALSVWWLSIFLRGLTEGMENDLFTLTYPIISLIGGLAGLVYARKWGGFKSKLGLTITMLSFGLLAQFLGQLLYNFYIFVLDIPEPYPSIGDASYFASVIFYIFGAYYLTKVIGLRFSLKSIRGKFLAVIIPALILVGSYLLLLRGYEFDFSDKIILFLDFGFPIGQAIFVSFAILAWVMSADVLGGMMRKPIILLISALVFQYFADFFYSYQFSINAENMYVGDYLDFLYFVSYFYMSWALFSIGNMFYKVQES